MVSKGADTPSLSPTQAEGRSAKWRFSPGQRTKAVGYQVVDSSGRQRTRGEALDGDGSYLTEGKNDWRGRRTADPWESLQPGPLCGHLKEGVSSMEKARVTVSGRKKLAGEMDNGKARKLGRRSLFWGPRVEA